MKVAHRCDYACFHFVVRFPVIPHLALLSFSSSSPSSFPYDTFAVLLLLEGVLIALVLFSIPCLPILLYPNTLALSSWNWSSRLLSDWLNDGWYIGR